MALAHLATPAEIDPGFIDEVARQPWLVTVEDHSVRTGLGCCLAEALFARGHTLPHLRLGVERYSPSGNAEDLFREAGLDAASIAQRVREFAGSRAAVR